MPYDHEMDFRLPAESVTNERVTFIRRTYAHLAGAVLAFVAVEALLLQLVTANQIFGLIGTSPWNLLFLMLAFWGASWLAQVWARSETSVGLQYLGLALYVVAEAVIFLPILYIATHTPALQGEKIIPTAGVLTLAVFAGLSLTAFLTKKDYSFLRPILCVGSMIAFGVIICAIFLPINLGLFFSFAMVALISGYILYETSAILLHYPTHLYVSAALMLFSSVATLFFWILRILMLLSRER
jgi:FtsH-binding integral membrane protein